MYSTMPISCYITAIRVILLMRSDVYFICAVCIQIFRLNYYGYDRSYTLHSEIVLILSERRYYPCGICFSKIVNTYRFLSTVTEKLL